MRRVVAFFSVLVAALPAAAQSLTFQPESVFGGPNSAFLPGSAVDLANTYVVTGVPARVFDPNEFQSGQLTGYVRLSDLIAAANANLGISSAQIFAQYDELRRGIVRSYDGTAIALALAGAATSLSPGKNFGLSVNYGGYQGSNAIGVAGTVRINDFVTANGGVAYAGGHSVGGRAGVNFEW